MSWFARNKLDEIMEGAVEKATHAHLGDLYRRLSEFGKIADLEKEIRRLETERASTAEKNARTTREIEHKLGLHKAQVEFESKKAREEAILEVEQKNLEKDKTRFEDQMEFQTEAIQKQVDMLQGIIEPLIEALPSAKFLLKSKEG